MLYSVCETLQNEILRNYIMNIDDIHLHPFSNGAFE